MTAYEDMTAPEIRAELEDCRRRAVHLMRNFFEARDAGNRPWEMGIETALRAQLAQERRLARLLHLGIAA